MVDTGWCESCRNWVDGDEPDCPVCRALRERDDARAKLADALNILTQTGNRAEDAEEERDDARSVARYYRKCIYDFIELGWVKQKGKALALLDKELEETPWLGEKDDEA